MGKLIKSFTFDRNTFLRTPELSADKAVECINLVNAGQQLDKTLNNKIGALSSYMGLFEKDGNAYKPTELSNIFLELYKQSPEDSWRWLITRSFWLYQVPNGTNAKVNNDANDLNISFNFFYSFLQVLTHLQSLPENNGYLYYDELCAVMDDDDNWKIASHEFYQKVLNERANLPPIDQKLGFLEELDNQYDLPRDNYNGIINKSFQQTGFFKYARGNHGKFIGISINDKIDGVLRERLRFILDNPVKWETAKSWTEYLSVRETDIPLKVSLETITPAEPVPELEINKMPLEVTADFKIGRFQIDEEVIRRFIASLMSKRFVILSGLSGSGKTKIAQLFAAWLDIPEVIKSEPFEPGTEIQADRAKYTIKAISSDLIELINAEGNGKKTIPLPRNLIEEWADIIKSNKFSVETSNKDIRKVAKSNSKYDPFIHGYASQLKASALHLLQTRRYITKNNKRYIIVPVEANWTSTEDIFGYPDALSKDRYIKRPALDLVMRAKANYESSEPLKPYFLILDEMNLSHVERYFAAVLSAIESGEPISLHSENSPISGVPSKLSLPPNLFVIGTINIDETTYMFSPKVLDRSNVVEFRVPAIQMSNYLKEPKGIRISKIEGKGHTYSESFVNRAMQPLNLQEDRRHQLSEEIDLFFTVLSDQEAEFGYRTAKEMARFLQFHEQLSMGAWDFRIAWDAQVLQKLLPKIHGSQRKLEPLLRSLAVLCHDWRPWHKIDNESEKNRMRNDLIKLAKDAADLRRRDLDPLSAKIEADKLLGFINDGAIKDSITEKANGNMKTEMHRFSFDTSYLQLSYEKVIRMLNRLQRDGFTSFSEA